jgi:hypothetical protein
MHPTGCAPPSPPSTASRASSPNENYPAGLIDCVYEILTAEELDMFGFRAETNGFNNRFVLRSARDRRTNTNYDAPYVGELRSTHHQGPMRVSASLDAPVGGASSERNDC